MDVTSKSTEGLLRALERGYRACGAREGRVLLAVSGGADSTALLMGSAALRKGLGLLIEVASLDHGLRPEAAADVAAVRTQALRMGLPFHTRKLGLAGASGLEARAREARYAALESIRSERQLQFVATAHTASDQAETLLMRLSRGASLRGASGILPSRERILRPMLGCTRDEVEAFLAAQGTGFVQDPMNADRTFLRTRIRQDALPALVASAGSRTVRHLADFAALAHEDEALLGALSDEAYQRLSLGDGALDATGVRALLSPLRRRVLARLLEAGGIDVSLTRVNRLVEALESGRRVHLSRDVEFRCAGGAARLVETRSAVTPKVALQLFPEQVVWDEAAGYRFGLSRVRPEGVEFMQLPPESAPLLIRRRVPGDRVGIGPGGGSRKLSDVLVDLRTRAEVRDALPIVTDARGQILFIPGVFRARVEAPSGLYLSASLHVS